jgi:uncharacterized membrane protein YccC
MTTKIVTVRVPSPIYATLCRDAGELGVPVFAHIRRLIEREHEAEQITALRQELMARLDQLAQPEKPVASHSDELLLLCRAVAAHLNPQLVAQVRAKLNHVTPGASS